MNSMVPAPAECTVRLLAFAVTVLTQHQVNKRGRSNFCGWTRWKWRFWHPRPRCTVCRALAFALSEAWTWCGGNCSPPRARSAAWLMHESGHNRNVTESGTNLLPMLKIIV